ncbi:MAG: ATP-dependent protease, partial [Chthonomonadaceae bacterium]|nr:ATP-dependent protease [Chthonomonadaceae bacterium]
ILGLPAPEIQEARERIMAAFQGAELEFPKKKVIINLSPSSVRKSGTGHDLPIAIKIISETTDLDWPERILAWGELALSGNIKPVGRMAALLELLVMNLEKRKPDLLILSSRDASQLQELLNWRAKQALSVPEETLFLIVDHLKDLNTGIRPSPLKPKPWTDKNNAQVSTNELLPLASSTERILKISLIGKHHVLFLGPKGVGKSESLHWFKTLSPPAKPKQIWERILNSESREMPLAFSTPVRQVHAQVRPAHLLGSFGARGYQAGELALAHGGLFIADEFMEWPRDAKECLREPLQNRRLTLSRVKGSVEAPCDFQFIATGNLCPCGGLPSPFRAHDSSKRYSCRCRAAEMQAYLHKLSGPILDRIDLTFILTETERKTKTFAPEVIQTEIQSARDFALKNFGYLPAELPTLWLEETLPKRESIQKLLSELPSLRSRHKVLRVARSIQALEKSADLEDVHVFEAKTYRLNQLQ